MTWPLVAALAVAAFFVLGCLWIYIADRADEREYQDRLREMQDEIDGIVR